MLFINDTWTTRKEIYDIHDVSIIWVVQYYSINLYNYISIFIY